MYLFNCENDLTEALETYSTVIYNKVLSHISFQYIFSV